MATMSIGINLFKDLFYELVSYYEFQLARDIGKLINYENIPKEHKFIIPLYGESLISKEMQYLLLFPIIWRLCDIRQLAYTYFFLPGATHSRLEHSLGVMHRCNEILQRIKSNKIINITEDDEMILNTAALLHDIGHPAWGHALDGITGYVIENLTDTDFHLFSQSKLDNSIAYYLLMHNEQLIKSLKTISTNFKNKNIIKVFKEIVAQIISEEEEPILNKLEDSGLMKKVHYLTTILGTYKGRGGINADRLDWIIRDSHHAQIGAKFPTDLKEEFKNFEKENLGNKYEIELKDSDFLDITGDFTKTMNKLRNDIYKVVYEGSEKAFIDSLLTRLAYTVINIVSGVGEGIASTSTKSRAIIGYLLMPDHLMKEYTHRIITLANAYNHLLSSSLSSSEYIVKFISKSANLLDLFPFMPYMLHSMSDTTLSRIKEDEISFSCIFLKALGKTILIIPADNLAIIFKKISIGFQPEDELEFFSLIYNFIITARANPIQALKTFLLENSIQMKIDEEQFENKCYLLINYYFFRRIDDEFREKIKSIDELYAILKGEKDNLNEIPFIFIVIDQIFEDPSELRPLYGLTFEALTAHFVDILSPLPRS